jgi:hypothetical protein
MEATGSTAVNLESEETLQEGLVVHEVGGRNAIDPDPHLIALGLDEVVIPLV